MAVVQSVQEQRIILYNIGWDTYEGLLRDHANTSAPRFTYDRGTLEIMSPLPEHERFNRAIQLLVPIVVEEMGAEVYSRGSTTFNREDLLRGFEPDSCFYLQNAARVHGNAKVDLHVDPAPDLVVEIDITHPSPDKLPIYARIGVPKVWRYDGARLEILALEGDKYTARPSSRALPTCHGRCAHDVAAAQYGRRGHRLDAERTGVGAHTPHPRRAKRRRGVGAYGIRPRVRGHGRMPYAPTPRRASWPHG